jgi:hypothetical protein
MVKTTHTQREVLPEWIEQYGQQLLKDMLKDEASWLRALQKARDDLDRFYSKKQQ